MNSLRISSYASPESPHIPIFEFAGVWDLNTSGQFEHFLEAVRAQAVSRLVCDLTQLTRLTAFGWGQLLGFFQAAQLNGISVRWVGMPSRYRNLLERLPASRWAVRWFEDVTSALGDFRNPTPETPLYQYHLSPAPGEILCGVPFDLTIEVRDRQQLLVDQFAGSPHLLADKGMLSPSLAREFHGGRWHAQVLLTGPGEVRLWARDENGYGEVRVNVLERGKAVSFPHTIQCPGCHRKNIVGKTDISRCIHCNEIYFVDPFGHVIPLKSGEKGDVGVRQLEFRIPSDVNYLNHVRNFIVGITSEEKISEEKIGQIEMSLDEALANIIEHAYHFDAFQEIRVKVALHPDRFEIVLQDHGRPFDDRSLPLPDLKQHIEDRKVGGLGRYLIRTLMDVVEYRCDARINELRMVKYY